jgi:DNA-directed RNA polymerase subunit RPC12/RpoP
MSEGSSQVPEPETAPPEPHSAAPADGMRPPANRSLPPEERKFPCKQCGAKLDFDPASQGLKCPYCGYLEKIDSTNQPVEEHDLQEYLARQVEAEATLDGRTNEVHCSGCGAIVLLENKVATDRCPFCNSALTNTPEIAHAMIVPESLLPIAIDQRQAIDAFNRWISSLWFAPSTLRQFANLGQLSGVYVPYWTYDSTTRTHYTGMRGDDYTTTETYTTTDSQGRPQTETRQVTHTDWSPVSGDIEKFFDDVLVPASTSLPDEFVQQLEPWDLEHLAEFKPEFLRGFKTERYTVGLADGFQRAQSIMDTKIRQLCCGDIGGDHQQLHTVTTQHFGVTFKHILLPIWLAVYRCREKTYRILVNARSGEVVGSRPYSWVKITCMVLAITAAVVTIGIFVASRQ